MRDRPLSDQPQELGFTPQPMVEWFAPGALAKALARVVLSSVFGAYADKRELQGVGPIGDALDYSQLDELWIDYVADVADGFDATYTVASALASDLQLSVPDTDLWYPTRRGDILIMGGDQVYPTADYQNYKNRLIGPYRAALPAVDGPDPHLFAIPGNHDWYDGLTAFLRVFCQGNRIGAWQTRQRRSYFALQLPHGWWLWAIDIQFESYLDPAQVQYFRDIIGPQLRAGDSVILCSATPSWIRANEGIPDAYENIDFLEREIVTPRGGSIRLGISGDKHHYARYEEIDGDRQFLTSGGGGAYLSATHHLPKELHVPPLESTDLDKSEPSHYRLMTTYPSALISKALRFGVFRLPFANGSFWAILSIAYAVVAWSVMLGLRAPGQSLADLFRSLELRDLLNGLFARPLGFMMAVILCVILIYFTQVSRRWKRWVLGGTQAISHLVLIMATVWGISHLFREVPDPILALGMTVILGVVGGLLGSWLLAIFLLVGEIFGANINEIYAAQHIEGYNNFLRIHMDREGVLTIHPVKIPKVPDWEFQPEGDITTPWFRTVGDPLECHLIETPIRMAPTPRA